MSSRKTQTTSVFRNKEGQAIFYRNWTTSSEPNGIVLIVHGLNSHSGYYEKFAAQLTENGYDVYAMDIRGRGNSEGERYYIADYHDSVEDIDLMVDIARSAHPTIAIFLLGHSAGGVFASVYAVGNQGKLNGLIYESFAFQTPAPGFALAIMKFLGYIIPHTRLIRLNNEDFSRDKAIVDKMNNDPLLANEKQPAKTMQQLLLAAEYLKKEMPQIKLPLLILHGTADKATKPTGSQYFMEHTSSTDKQLKLYEGYYHDLLNDKYNTIIIKEIIRWLTERG
ncbi:alpha/beta hydrolase [Spirosoma endbachense]|uniref:Monoacylglycerol lipase n=1 Tax=Spirosoma endbachense TaxID=2666025 RepID=A0A6P1VXD9_9BACT|nr:alpha/beta hydrolase [Spirosoma endbachense]QHV96490.1 alpha/beta fold hydrolase [Spirosoma endbachense]